jgi:folate-binding protein YgfZ
MTDRIVLSLTGTDRIDFLQGLVTNDITKAESSIVYTALLTPQGKYLADFFVVGQPDQLLIDVDASIAPALAQRFTMYRLRADVQIATTDLVVSRGTGAEPAGALPDPRSPAMGWRTYGNEDVSDATDWAALETANVIPKTGIELTPDTYILEAGFERLNGVDFRKGCFVGQEIVARMKHKANLRKGLVGVAVAGNAPEGTAIMAQDRAVGTLYRTAEGKGIAFLRFDRVADAMQAGGATVSVFPPVASE